MTFIEGKFVGRDSYLNTFGEDDKQRFWNWLSKYTFTPKYTSHKEYEQFNKDDNGDGWWTVFEATQRNNGLILDDVPMTNPDTSTSSSGAGANASGSGKNDTKTTEDKFREEVFKGLDCVKNADAGTPDGDLENCQDNCQKIQDARNRVCQEVHEKLVNILADRGCPACIKPYTAGSATNHGGCTGNYGGWTSCPYMMQQQQQQQQQPHCHSCPPYPYPYPCCKM